MMARHYPPADPKEDGMEIREALTFDDVLLRPAESAVLPAETDTRTKLTRYDRAWASRWCPRPWIR